MPQRLHVPVTLALAALVAFATLAPPGLLDGGSGRDKLHHVIGFAVLALPTAMTAPREVLRVGALLVLFGAAIEIVQPFVGRDAEMMDLVADAAGVAVGTLAGLALGRLRALFAS